MMMMMVMMVMMMMICLCFFAAVGFAGFALVFCFSSGAALGVEGVWPLLTHVILAAALESFWLKRFGSSFLAVDRELVYIKKKTLESGILAQAHGNHSCQGPGPAPNGAAKRAAHSRRWGSRACGGRGRTPQPLWPSCVEPATRTLSPPLLQRAARPWCATASGRDIRRQPFWLMPSTLCRA